MDDSAFCRHPADGQWYLYDDTKVKTIDDPKEVITKDAYLLFYQREPLENHPYLYYNDVYRPSPAPTASMYEFQEAPTAPQEILERASQKSARMESEREPEAVTSKPLIIS